MDSNDLPGGMPGELEFGENPPNDKAPEAPREPDFQGFHPLRASFTPVPDQVWDLRIPGLTSDLQWTLATLSRVTAGEALLRGGSMYAFVALSWARWMELLQLRSVNAVKARLDRLVALRLIEVIPGVPGPWGSTPNRYRLRWENGGQAMPRSLRAQERGRGGHRPSDFGATLDAQGNQAPDAPSPSAELCTDPRCASRGRRLAQGYQETDAPLERLENQEMGAFRAEAPAVESLSADTPRGAAGAPPSWNGMEQIHSSIPSTEKPQAIRPSIPVHGRESNGRTAPSSFVGFDLVSWLRGDSDEPWPEPLMVALETLLDPAAALAIAERSPWTAEGAWAIFQAIRVKGSNLNNKPGTLWNALAHPDKGRIWLAAAGHHLRSAGWKALPGDGTAREDWGRKLGSNRLRKLGLSRMPCDKAPAPPLQEDPNEGDSLEPDEDPEDEEPAARAHPSVPYSPAPYPPAVPARKVEELRGDLKEDLRFAIEQFRTLANELQSTPAAAQPGLLDAFGQSMEQVRRLLEPELPIRVYLPFDSRCVDIRRKEEIKWNTVNAIYRAVS